MTSVSLPASAPFPVIVSTVLCVKGDNVAKHMPLFRYKYWDYQDDPLSSEDPPAKVRVERIGSFESPIEGEIVAVDIYPKMEIAHNGVALYVIQEKCTHTVQYGGLCALCGKAVEDEKDYSGYTYEDRATIAMSHDNSGLRVSAEEAAKIENATSEKLAQDKKLILVVDLDQTVIHATVDPTVGEWQQDPQNPNYPYVKDVRSFELDEEPVLPPGYTGPKPPANKCSYYVKLRPGLVQFLARVFELYELHVYTMATRNYALAIAQIIDPSGKYFGDRILSRDESGSLTHKNLKRLFPSDQSMVVIIDDRGDVWQWDANLIKVVPYDFFVGIGDINSSFLPKKSGQLLGPSNRGNSIASLQALDEEQAGDGVELDENKETLSESEAASNKTEALGCDLAVNETKALEPVSVISESTEVASPVDRMLSLGGGEDNKNLLIEQSLTRSQLVEQQQHERPLAKLQHSLDKMIHDHETPTPESDHHSDEDDDHIIAANEHLLRDDDRELVTLQTALENIHTEYFRLHAEYSQKNRSFKPDLTNIIPRLKSQCLKGVVVLFSGILPLGLSIDNADIVIWCRQFGVKVVNEVYPDVTHVVSRDPRMSAVKFGLTLKVRVAKKTLTNVKIVSPDWLFACLSQWAKVPEKDFLISLPENDWFVPQQEVDKYHQDLEAQGQRLQTQGPASVRLSREGSISLMEEYDFNDANAEVDDFLAGLSEDEFNDDEDEDESEDKGDKPQPSGSSLLKGLLCELRAKRRASDLDSDSDIDHDAEPDTNFKKQRTDSNGSSDFLDDMDELEKELLDELDNMDE